ncbi:MAG: V-type ATP synthase subunit E family protein [Candidatus Omnitrophota bacterium]
MPKKENYLELNKGNADEIRKVIHSEVTYETKEIFEIANKEAAEISKNANNETQKIKEKSYAQLDKQINNIKEKVFSAINLEKKRITLGEKSKLIEKIFAQIKLQSEDFRSSNGYRDFLKKACFESVEVIDSLSLDVLYSPFDENLMTVEFQEELRDSCRNKFDKNISLAFMKSDFNDIGFIIQSKDGKVIFDNTFTARLRRAYDDIYMDLLKKL